MKKLTLSLALLFLTVFTFAGTDLFTQAEGKIKEAAAKRQEQAKQTQEEKLVLVYFSFEKCPPCHKFKRNFFNAFLTTYHKDYNGKLEVVLIDTLKGFNQEIFQKNIAFYGMQDKPWVPTIIVGDTHLVGNEVNGENVIKAIEKAFVGKEKTKFSFDVTNHETSALITAVRSGDFEAVRKAYAQNPDLKAKDASGKTALINAVLAGDQEITKFIISKTPAEDIDVTDDNGMSALLYLPKAGGDNTEIAKILIEDKKANVKHISTEGSSILKTAASYGDTAILNMVLPYFTQEEINFDFKNQGWPAVISAATCGHEEIVKILFKAGATVTEKNREIIEKYVNDANIKTFLLSQIQ
ncbi:thiol-disulfide isomerase/thioredoxin [Elusimicrobium posterum]|uniref:ankyrin repeat domain-containing protein n=1 Tax=Elusimicrobium posterum TaxID=3116653 RepID=UPI003C777DCA